MQETIENSACFDNENSKWEQLMVRHELITSRLGHEVLKEDLIKRMGNE